MGTAFREVSDLSYRQPSKEAYSALPASTVISVSAAQPVKASAPIEVTPAGTEKLCNAV